MNNNSTKEDEIKLLDIQIIATVIYILSLFISYIITYNDKCEILNNKPFLDKKMSQNISVFNRVVVVVLTLTFLYINYKNIEIAKIKNKKDLTPFKLQITASELSTVAAIIVLYTVLTSGEYSVIAGAENPSL